MKQYTQPELLWCANRKEPNIQIDILREIAVNGKQTKSDLAKNLGYAYTTIDTTISRNAISDNLTRLFWRNGKIKKKNIDQTSYSLTEFGMVVLLQSHYKKNEENDQNGKSNKPYLNFKEFCKFITIFEKEHSQTDASKLPLNAYSWIYFVNNPSVIKKQMPEFKDNKKLQKLTSSINSIKLKLEEMENEKTAKEHETYELLTSLLISSSKK